MRHAEAGETQAAERYALGEMDEGERDRYEEHFFSCPECAAAVKAAVLFVENAKAVLERDDLPAEDEPRKRVLLDQVRRFVSWKPLVWPVPAGVAAGLALLLGGPASYLALVEVPRLERARAEAESLQAVPGQFLAVSRGEAPVVSVSGSQRIAVLTLSPSMSRTARSILCEVRDATGRAVLSSVVPAPAPGDELRILLPTGTLRPGAHVVAVAGLEGGPARPPEPAFVRYPFTLERR